MPPFPEPLARAILAADLPPGALLQISTRPVASASLGQARFWSEAQQNLLACTVCSVQCAVRSKKIKKWFAPRWGRRAPLCEPGKKSV